MPEYYFLIVYKAYKLKSDETADQEIVRILTESEFEAFDTSKVCVLYHCKQDHNTWSKCRWGGNIGRFPTRRTSDVDAVRVDHFDGRIEF